MFKKGLVYVLMSTLVVTVFGQDMHFSQFFSSPLTLNPANTGMFNEDWRISAIHRQQWRAANAYFSSTALGADLNLRGGILRKDKVGLGLVYLDDSWDKAIMKVQTIGLSAAYQHKLGHQKRHVVRVGIMGGYKQLSVNYESLEFENQYAGYVFDPNRSNGEAFTANKASHLLLHSGVTYTFKYSPKLDVTLGASFFNINTPKEVFTSFGANNDLSSRKSFQFGSVYKISKRVQAHAHLLVMQQSKSRYVLPVGYLGYLLSSRKEMIVYLGGMYRIQDAVVLLTGMKLGNVDVKFSYDVANSSIRSIQGIDGTASNRAVTAWELSLIMTGFLPRSTPREFTVPCTIF